MSDFNDSGYTPKKIGNFNIPKNVIECKIDTLAVLELLLRKNIATWEEIDEIREAVVMHMNVMYPELQLTYSTPQPLKDEAPFAPPEGPAKPLFYTAPPPDMTNSNEANAEAKPAAQGAQPLYQNVQPPKITQSTPRPGMPVKPVSQSDPSAENAETGTADAAASGAAQPLKPMPGAPKPILPNAGPPKILSNPPRKKF